MRDRGRLGASLQALYAEDLADARRFGGEEAFIASQARRARIEPLVAAGELRSGADYYHAALIFQHGERSEHWAQAHLLARTAADRGHAGARYLAAAAHDRWLMRQGHPQKYGTNSVRDGDRMRLWDYDPATTDAERAAWDVPALAELHARAAALPAPGPDPAPFVTVEVDGLRLDLFDREPAPAGARPVYAVPCYTPLGDETARPAYQPDAVTLWRLGALYCAKGAGGEVLWSWHACRWAVPGATPAITAAVSARLGRAPQWMSGESDFWARVGVGRAPGLGWIVGGRLPRPALERIAQSLP